MITSHRIKMLLIRLKKSVKVEH